MGFAAVKKNDPVSGRTVWSYIDSTGASAFGKVFEDAGPFTGDLAMVKIDGKWGYINRKGDIVVHPDYDQAFSFSP